MQYKILDNTHSGMEIRLNEMSYKRNNPRSIANSARKMIIAAADKWINKAFFRSSQYAIASKTAKNAYKYISYLK